MFVLRVVSWISVSSAHLIYCHLHRMEWVPASLCHQPSPKFNFNVSSSSVGDLHWRVYLVSRLLINVWSRVCLFCVCVCWTFWQQHQPSQHSTILNRYQNERVFALQIKFSIKMQTLVCVCRTVAEYDEWSMGLLHVIAQMTARTRIYNRIGDVEMMMKMSNAVSTHCHSHFTAVNICVSSSACDSHRHLFTLKKTHDNCCEWRIWNGMDELRSHDLHVFSRFVILKFCQQFVGFHIGRVDGG